MQIKDPKKKFESFGWYSKKCNGHNSEEIFNLIKKRDKRKPMALVAKTIKGYPVSFMKNVPMWHYKSPSKQENGSRDRFTAFFRSRRN